MEPDTGHENEPSDEQVLDRYPKFAIDFDNIERFRGYLQHRLMVNRCADCGTWHEPPRALCPACWSMRVEPTEVTGAGTVGLATVLHHGTPTAGVDYEKGYVLVAVELTEQPGLRIVAPLIDETSPESAVGSPVELVWLERAGAPVPAFRRVSA
jgi:uncharacterized OB-fold protein